MNFENKKENQDWQMAFILANEMDECSVHSKCSDKGLILAETKLVEILLHHLYKYVQL